MKYAVVTMSFPFRLRASHEAIQWSVLSGIAALIYQVVLQKVFSYVLGYALLSTTIVVAAYMLGLALGGFLIGLFCDRLTQRGCLLLYLLLETGIGLCGFGSLIGYKVYLSALGGLLANPVFIRLMSSVAFRSALAMSALLPMTTLMGATLPVLTLGVRAAADGEEEGGTGNTVSITSLYSANLLGGMVGVIISAFVLIPLAGLWGAAIFGLFNNFYIANLVFRYRSSTKAGGSEEKHAETRPEVRQAQKPQTEPITWGTVWFLSFVSGLMMFALEILWTHLLGAVIGGSVYAFADMLFAVFVGLYLAARQEASSEIQSRRPLAILVLWGSILLALSIPFYAWSPFLFSFLGLFSPNFLVREFAILAVACFLIVPVATLLSRIFPRLLAAGVTPQHKGRRVGFLLAVNTLGCLLGLFLGNFILIPVFGSEISLKGLAATLGLIAAALVWRTRSHIASAAAPISRRGWVAVGLAFLAVIVPSWPPSLFLSGRNIYFGLNSDGEFKPLYYMGEDAESGFVTVARRSDGTVELRTNGKFQGNNTGEMSAQFAFGYLPALAAPRTENAFVIGCGTGVTMRALADAGFRHISLAEISKPMVYAARNYFRKENGGILDDPRVTIIHDDGRDALALSKDKYDVISIELSSIWIAGAANLYSSDFYSVVHRKLAPGGVMQQWVQLHNMRLEDLYVLINTVHARFRYVSLWFAGNQGQLLASDEPLGLDWERMTMLAASHAEARYVSAQEIYQIPYHIILDSSEVEQFLHGHASAAIVRGQLIVAIQSGLIDSDLFPYLEYATPLGNTAPYQEILIPAFLSQWTSRPVMVPFRNLPDKDLPLANALLAYRNGDCKEVSQFLGTDESVPGIDRAALFRGCTANHEISRVDVH